MTAGQVKDEICKDVNILSQRSRETTTEEMRTLGIVARLLNMMDAGWTGAIGLAAIQIGVPIRVALYIPNRINPAFSKNPVTLINPVIVGFGNLRPRMREGCISLPDKRYDTYRYNNIEIENGPADARVVLRATDVEAQVIQHEIDHMDGLLCHDRVKIPGRNEPCHCGSERKFKKCHGI